LSIETANINQLRKQLKNYTPQNWYHILIWLNKMLKLKLKLII